MEVINIYKIYKTFKKFHHVKVQSVVIAFDSVGNLYGVITH